MSGYSMRPSDFDVGVANSNVTGAENALAVSILLDRPMHRRGLRLRHWRALGLLLLGTGCRHSGVHPPQQALVAGRSAAATDSGEGAAAVAGSADAASGGAGAMAGPSAGTDVSSAAAGASGILGSGSAGSTAAGGGDQAAAGGGAPDASDAGAECGGGQAVVTRSVPTIWLVVDGSGSMVASLGDTSRWLALRQALMDPTTGVVKLLESRAKFGLIEFDGRLVSGGSGIPLPDGGTAMFSSPPATTCPRLVSIEPKINNFADLDKVYTPDPLGGSTPTDKALIELMTRLSAAGSQPGTDLAEGPTIVVLATDGAPNDQCSTDFFPPDVRPAVISAVQELAAAGAKTYVISLAGDDVMLSQHLDDVAKAGATGMGTFVPMNKDDLVHILDGIAGPISTCDVKLNGAVKPGSQCKGVLRLDGVQLRCDDDNGWRLKDSSTITITGSACDAYKAEASPKLEVAFPCAAFVAM
jgi:hypothetical protein